MAQLARNHKKSLTLVELLLGIVLLALVVAAVSLVHTTFIKNITKDIRHSMLYQRTSFAMEHITKRIQASNYLTVSGTTLNLFKTYPGTPPTTIQSQYYLDANKTLNFVKDISHPGTSEALLKNVIKFQLEAVEPLDSPPTQYRAARIIIQAQDAKRKRDIADSFLQSLAGCRVVAGDCRPVRLFRPSSGKEIARFSEIQPALDAALSGDEVQCMGQVIGFDGVFYLKSALVMGQSCYLKGSYNIDFNPTSDITTVIDASAIPNKNTATGHSGRALVINKLMDNGIAGVENFIFRNCKGDAIRAVSSITDGAKVDISHNIFEANYFAGMGYAADPAGAIVVPYLETGTVEIRGNVFRSSVHDSYDGSLIYVQVSPSSGTNIKILGNTVSDINFDMKNTEAKVFEIFCNSTGAVGDYVEISGNSITGLGAAYLSSIIGSSALNFKDVLVNNNKFVNNDMSVDDRNGIISLDFDHSGNFTLSNNTFDNNQTSAIGNSSVLVYLSAHHWDSPPNIAVNTFRGNTVDTRNTCSLIYVHDKVNNAGGPVISGNTFFNNNLNSPNVANILDVSERSGHFVYRDNIFEQNTIHGTNSGVTGGFRSNFGEVEGNVFKNNTLEGSNLGIILGFQGNDFTIKNNIFFGNKLIQGAGPSNQGIIMIFQCQDVILSNNLIYSNVTSGNPGGYLIRGTINLSQNNSLALINNTIVNNAEPVRISGNFQIDSCIIRDNGGFENRTTWDGDTNHSNIYLSGGAVAAGTGNINVDPDFENVANSDFHLKSSSFCKDAGDPEPRQNDIDGTRNDMGAYGGPDPL